jgi:hypothetical protein
MSDKKPIFLCLLVLEMLLSSCAIKRPNTDYSVFEQNSGPNSTPVESAHDNQLEFPMTPGAAATPAEGVGVKKPGITLVLGGAGVASFATVGLLKRLKNEGIKIEMIVASGWPAVFALGNGFMKSVHDLEWFAMRLQGHHDGSLDGLSKRFPGQQGPNRLNRSHYDAAHTAHSRSRLGSGFGPHTCLIGRIWPPTKAS